MITDQTNSPICQDPVKHIHFFLNRLDTALAVLVFGTLLSHPWQAAEAAPVTSKQAAAAVAAWLNLDRAPLGEELGTTVQRVDTFSDNAGSALYYVVYLAPSGFVIAAADDQVQPIVGFARAGKFDPSTGNPLGALASGDLSARVSYARLAKNAANPDTNALKAQAKWRRLATQEAKPASEGATDQALASVSDVRVAPLTLSTWDQGTAAAGGTTACYNYYTPPYGDGNKNNYWAGCVATAMAQLMRYYEFPVASVGSAGFEIYSDGSPLMYYLHGGTGPGGAYVWSDMPLMPPSSPTTTQCQAIGALVADAGATVGMSYRATGSSASLTDAKIALTTTFLYSSAVARYNNGSDIGANLINMVNPNLDARYPVVLGIKGPSGGHAVLADGYGYSDSTLFHHLNLGWSGAASAWYALPIVETSNYDFNVVHTCLYNLYTNGAGEIISGRVVDQIGRPVVAATVTAVKTGGGTYTTTTGSQGIYALARIPANSTYSITVTKTNFTTTSRTVTTGTSWDYTAASGNRWGVDFTNNMLTTVLDHLVWGPVGPTQYLNAPFPTTITARNLTNGVASGFAGPVTLSAYASGAGSPATIVGNLSPNSYLFGSEMTHGYAFTPNTNVQITAVRGYSTDKVSIWTDSGTLLASQDVSAFGSWTEAALATPITLAAGTTYRVGARIPQGTNGYFRTTSWPTTFAQGTVGQNFYWSYGDVFPTSVRGTAQGPMVDLRYRVVFSNSIPVSPATSGAFVNGVWNGTITVGQNATNVVLKANDGAGHTALSSPFNVITALRLLSPQRLAGGQFRCTISGPPGQKIEVLGSTNLSNPLSWVTVASFTNTTGTLQFTDSATGIPRRFYRAHQLP
ncbi:MAG TPA: C10 family peptidase [Candidatus Paceibacterota bacterium]|nr:C10 family peptidase [Verrucomicrobiota bacterium]HSA10390.1 C10 family peptidase [Candidatus Paceibacterota bacterium]